MAVHSYLVMKKIVSTGLKENLFINAVSFLENSIFEASFVTVILPYAKEVAQGHPSPWPKLSDSKLISYIYLSIKTKTKQDKKINETS
jgi:hypothetical protein